MNIYETVKSLVTVREAAERYGLNINRHSMACCPFHEDRHPSMKLDERYHCFGCGADGDVIDFTAKLFHLSPYEAADKLNQDFGAGCLPEPAHPPPRPREPLRHCREVLLAMELQLRRQKQAVIPTDRAKPIPVQYAEVCQMYDFICCLSDFLEGGTGKEKRDVIAYLTDGVLERYETALRKGVIEYGDIFVGKADLAGKGEDR